NATWFLRTTLTPGSNDVPAFTYGVSTDTPVMGDWNGDGTKTPGIFRNGVWVLQNSNTTGSGSISFAFGVTGDIPIVGDWNHIGADRVGVVRFVGGMMQVFLDNNLTAGSGDINFTFT